jgi:tRNA threonylcarbamoyladenosine biosynthesis protein TsaE
MTIQVSHSLEETAQIAHEWLRYILAKNATNKKSATTIGLSGHLGAGKTAFTKCVAKELGIAEDVTSPTFVIMKIYDIDLKKVADDLIENSKKSFPWKKLVHIDAYRLEQGRELEAINFAQYAADPDNLILIEWPENVKGVVEKLGGYSQINFSVGEGENERSIVWS